MSIVSIEEAVARNNSIAGALRDLGRAQVGTNYKWIKKEIQAQAIDASHFSTKSRGRPQIKKYTDHEAFSENSPVSRGNIKRRIIGGNVIPYKCTLCNCDSTWKGKSLTLVLDHKNGKRDDNRIENLRFLCPNCNSQEPTFAGRNIRGGARKPKTYCKCGKVSPAGLCRSCAQLKREPLHMWPAIEVLCKRIRDTSFVQVAREIGLTDNGVRGYISRKLKIPRNQVPMYVKMHL